MDSVGRSNKGVNLRERARHTEGAETGRKKGGNDVNTVVMYEILKIMFE